MPESFESKVLHELFALQDESYGDFQSKLMPDIPRERVIGVRIPQLRQKAKQLWKEPGAQAFLHQLPHFYYEENNLHGFFLEQLTDFDQTVAELERFLPYVDNWATCDLMKPKVLRKDLNRLLPVLQRWMTAEPVYQVRFAIGLLMSWYLDEAFQPDFLDWVASVRREEYYIRMMVAWYFATALAQQYDLAIPYLQTLVMDPWTHNKAIQKAVESRRLTAEQKAYLRTLKLR
jgi:3-methyladenine DNA glycosylase AlkD